MMNRRGNEKKKGKTRPEEIRRDNKGVWIGIKGDHCKKRTT